MFGGTVKSAFQSKKSSDVGDNFLNSLTEAQIDFNSFSVRKGLRSS